MNGLLNWIDGFKEKPSHIFVVHGEDTVTDSFAATITDRFGIPAFAPYSGGCVDLATDTILSEGIRLPKKAVEKPAKARALTAFNRVVAAAKHLMDVEVEIQERLDPLNTDLIFPETGFRHGTPVFSCLFRQFFKKIQHFSMSNKIILFFPSSDKIRNTSFL